MKTVVVGGHSRNIGKTSVVAGIVAALADRDWTAVKITQYGHGVCSESGEPCGCAPEHPECPFTITEEQDRHGRGDTCRFLAAGACRALWVRTAIGSLDAAMPALRQALAGDQHVIIESNSVLEFLAPDLYLVVLDPGVQDFKESALRFLDRADAFIVVGQGTGRNPRPTSKPVFHGKRGQYVTSDLVTFVAGHL